MMQLLQEVLTIGFYDGRLLFFGFNPWKYYCFKVFKKFNKMFLNKSCASHANINIKIIEVCQTTRFTIFTINYNTITLQFLRNIFTYEQVSR